ncbi:hypothetical protein [Phyllobacterium phragmitis]|nr:hypothetical protein [Phyllobacterium phragmitis]
MLLRRFTIFSLFLMGLAILTAGIIHEVRKANALKPIIEVSSVMPVQPSTTAGSQARPGQ